MYILLPWVFYRNKIGLSVKKTYIFGRIKIVYDISKLMSM